MTWVPFDPKGPLPRERRDVLVKLDTGINETGAVVVGYLRYAAGDKESPYFVCGGVPMHVENGERRQWVVTHWSDCLGDGFWAPGWMLTNATDKRSRV